ncbi:hypothetical protein AXG55_01155 [Silvanigrella aquatica]|uniref:P/Homo B domain-containing protein n=2 Tax=Silvanigrella aquatica TaxID=1915309 RepID=A0A1L4CXD1_9BACT|nr:hypothetical protein AXG55_01155 [Silvanigrella aquatica]
MDLKLYSHVENNKIQIINESYGTAAYSYTFSHNNSDFIGMSEINFITVKASGNQTCSTDLANKFYNKNKSSIDAKFLNFNFHNNESLKELPHNVKNYYKSIRPHISTMEKTASNPYRILVAGISHKGVINNTSTFGSNIWISGFSGGSSSTTLSKDSLNIDPKYVGILTTTIPINRPYGGTYFNKRLLPENREGYYNTELSGTSFATPMISGVIALLLEANPNLSYWDVKYILAKTANRNKLVSDPLPSCIKILSIIGDFSSDFLDLWKTGWVENKAGNFFHNYYGFGLVDTDRAIEMALNIKNGVTPSPYQGKKVQRIQNSLEIQNNSNQIIPPNSSITSELVITENINIDGVRVTPYILAAKADSISIQLVSPDETTSQQRGTHSTILYPGNSMIQLSEDESVIEDMPYPVDDYKKDLNDNSGAYLTNAFFEERSKGKWKIIITNHSLDKTFYLEGWKLEIYGH